MLHALCGRVDAKSARQRARHSLQPATVHLARRVPPTAIPEHVAAQVEHFVLEIARGRSHLVHGRLARV